MNSVAHLVVSNTIVLYHFTVPKSCQMSPWRKQLASFVHIFGKLVFVVHLTTAKEQDYQKFTGEYKFVQELFGFFLVLFYF